MRNYEDCKICRERIHQRMMKKYWKDLIFILIIIFMIYGYFGWTLYQNFKENIAEIETFAQATKIHYEPIEIEIIERQAASDYIEMELPEIPVGNFKTYMCYTKITNPTSRQWHLQRLAYTDENGFRRFNEKYMVAVGTYYATEVGKELRITLAGGKIFEAIVGDIKMEVETDAKNQYIPLNGDIIEFIVDANKLDPLTRKLGDSSNSGFEGEVIKIEEKIVW